ncbi:sugar-transfer associated ATP-grasp domain-containing protein [Paremcibacter congregatus]|uniref:sugar-transfer associated ATP-grasp domain-containing protein n=1 Tax=Paremcibacter congregatus TaxID=2043170 RepID=UPI0030EC0406|tara:strand:- start:4962 stop:6026 length:1065 start_codon:yes stop_codon:yes gene_type:complete
MKTKFKKIQYVYYVCKKRAQQGQLSVARQFLEIAWLQATQGFGYALYHLAGMWDKESSWAYKNSFLSQKKYAKKISEINLRKYHGLTQYKPTEKAIFEFFGIPTGKYIGVLNPIWGKTKEGKTFCSSNDMQELLKSYIDVKICFKIFEGAGGKGFKAFHIRKENGAIMAYSLSHGEKYLLSDLYQMLLSENPAGWVVEEYITQHSALSEMNPSSVNTIRMYVFQDIEGAVHVLGGFLRIGRQGSIVDNTSVGGLISAIDLKTGRLEAACIVTPELQSMARHPDHESQIEGIFLPFWEDAKELGVKTITILPNTRFAGLDIAITPNGPAMVEVNIQPDVDGLCYLKIPIAKVFNT